MKRFLTPDEVQALVSRRYVIQELSTLVDNDKVKEVTANPYPTRSVCFMQLY